MQSYIAGRKTYLYTTLGSAGASCTYTDFTVATRVKARRGFGNTTFLDVL